MTKRRSWIRRKYDLYQVKRIMHLSRSLYDRTRTHADRYAHGLESIVLHYDGLTVTIDKEKEEKK